MLCTLRLHLATLCHSRHSARGGGGNPPPITWSGKVCTFHQSTRLVHECATFYGPGSFTSYLGCWQILPIKIFHLFACACFFFREGESRSAWCKVVWASTESVFAYSHIIVAIAISVQSCQSASSNSCPLTFLVNSLAKHIVFDLRIVLVGYYNANTR